MYGKEYVEKIVEAPKWVTLRLSEHELNTVVAVIGSLSVVDFRQKIGFFGYDWDESKMCRVSLYCKALDAKKRLK